MGPTVWLEQRGKKYELVPRSGDVEIPEGSALCSLVTQQRPIVELDDQEISISWSANGQVAIWAIDVTNQVGFHRLKVTVAGVSHLYDFKTATAKARWNEIQLMADFCANAYFSYKRQFTYMARNGVRRQVRLPQVHFGWLRERLLEVEQLIQSINARPANRTISTYQVSPQGKRVSVPHTLRLLRERAHLLEPSGDGPIAVGDARYWPSQLVVRKPDQSSRLEEHTQIALFLRDLAAGCQSLAVVVPHSVRRDVEQYLARIQVLQAQPVFHGIALRPGIRAASIYPTVIQRTDRRYFRLREIHAEYGSNITYADDYSKSIRVNVKDVWEIYQTFVAHVIGNSLGLRYFSSDSDLRARSPDGWSMSSDDWFLYFDTVLPPTVLHSWRDGTRRPSSLRPDIVLINTKSGESVLLDAKFKLDSSGSRATQEDLFEMQGYLNGYSANRGGILFPGITAGASIIAGKGNALLELPIRADYFASTDNASSIHTYVREALFALLAQ